MFKFLNQNCLITFLNSKYLLIKSMDLQEVFLVSVDKMQLETNIKIKNYPTMTQSEDGICLLKLNDEKKFFVQYYDVRTDDSVEAIDYEMPNDPQTSSILSKDCQMYMLGDGILGFGYYEL